MPRAAYTRMANVYTGFGTTPPMQFRFAVACRFVPENHVVVTSPPITAPLAHITYNGLSSSAGSQTLVPPKYTVDYSRADLWEMQDDPGVFYIVMRADIVTPRFAGTPYRRVWVKPWP